MPLNEEVYALDEGKNSWLTMTKEQILTAITQAVNEGTIGDIDAGFITKIQEMNAQEVVKLWLGTMAEFQALTTKDTNTLYMFTDDPTVDDIEQSLTDLENSIEFNYNEIAKIKSGSTVVGEALIVSNIYLHKITISNSTSKGSVYLSITSSRSATYNLTDFKSMLGNNTIPATGDVNYGSSKALVYGIYKSNDTLNVRIFQADLTSSLSFADNATTISDTVTTLSDI